MEDDGDEYEPTPIAEVRFNKLITFPNPSGGRKAIQIVQPDFSSCCPKTGYPDYARVILRYVPDELCVELKSWKLYLAKFYGVGCFHEDVNQRVADTFTDAVKPRWCSIGFDWSARGGVHTATCLVWSPSSGYMTYPDTWEVPVFKKPAEQWNNRPS